MKQTIYDSGEYLGKNPGWHAEDSAWKVQQITRMLERHAIKPASVCEVGCGAGEILRCLQGELEDDCVLSGYDISPQALALAKSRENERLRYFHASMPPESAHFDLMLVIDVIEHVEDYYEFLRTVRSRGNRLIAHIPLDMCVNHLLRGKPLVDLRRAVGHIHAFTKDSALAVLGECGFRVVDHAYTCWAIEFPPRSWRRRLARLPRKLAYALDPDFAARVLGGFSLLVLAEPLDSSPARGS